MGFVVTIVIVVCAAITWFRSGGRPGSPRTWRRLLAMGWGLALLPVALIGLWLFGLNLLTAGLLLLCGAALVLRWGGHAASRPQG